MLEKMTIATRGSKLALWQAEYIADLLRKNYPRLEIELQIIKTSGDKILDVPLAQFGGKGLFVKEIEEALLEGKADLAVHSMKDMPGELPEGLKLGVMPKREDFTDCLLSVSYPDLESLPQDGCVGTSSLRRQAQILAKRPDLRIKSLRGNLDTRIRKLQEGQFDAIVVASAGIKRLGLEVTHTSRLEPPAFLPAIGQGALGLEYSKENKYLDEYLGFLDHPATRYAIQTERNFLQELEGGCQVPIGGFAFMESASELCFYGLVSDLQGENVVRSMGRANVQEAAQLGRRVAREILRNGGREILQELYAVDNP